MEWRLAQDRGREARARQLQQLLESPPGVQGALETLLERGVPFLSEALDGAHPAALPDKACQVLGELWGPTQDQLLATSWDQRKKALREALALSPCHGLVLFSLLAAAPDASDWLKGEHLLFLMRFGRLDALWSTIEKHFPQWRPWLLPGPPPPKSAPAWLWGVRARHFAMQGGDAQAMECFALCLEGLQSEAHPEEAHALLHSLFLAAEWLGDKSLSNGILSLMKKLALEVDAPLWRHMIIIKLACCHVFHHHLAGEAGQETYWAARAYTSFLELVEGGLIHPTSTWGMTLIAQTAAMAGCHREAHFLTEATGAIEPENVTLLEATRAQYRREWVRAAPLYAGLAEKWERRTERKTWRRNTAVLYGQAAECAWFSSDESSARAWLGKAFRALEGEDLLRSALGLDHMVAIERLLEGDTEGAIESWESVLREVTSTDMRRGIRIRALLVVTAARVLKDFALAESHLRKLRSSLRQAFDLHLPRPSHEEWTLLSTREKAEITLWGARFEQNQALYCIEELDHIINELSFSFGKAKELQEQMEEKRKSLEFQARQLSNLCEILRVKQTNLHNISREIQEQGEREKALLKEQMEKETGSLLEKERENSQREWALMEMGVTRDKVAALVDVHSGFAAAAARCRTLIAQMDAMKLNKEEAALAFLKFSEEIRQQSEKLNTWRESSHSIDRLHRLGEGGGQGGLGGD